MFCPKCGFKNKEEAKFCVSCGNKLDGKDLEKVVERVVTVSPTKNYKGIDVASMVLGIIGVMWALLILVASTELSIPSYYYYSGAYIFGYILSVVLFQMIFGILSLIFALVGKKANSNGFNTAGLWLSIVTFILTILAVVIVLCN